MRTSPCSPSPPAAGAGGVRGAEAPGRLAGRGGRRRLLHEPGHLRDALRPGPGLGPRRCAGSSPCSRASRPGRPTRTPASPARPPRCCCTWGRGSATAWPTCTTPAGPGPRCCCVVGAHATGHVRHDAPLRVRHHRPGAHRVGLGPHQRRRPGRRRRRRCARSPRPAGTAARSRRWCCRRTCRWSEGAALAPALPVDRRPYPPAPSRGWAAGRRRGARPGRGDAAGRARADRGRDGRRGARDRGRHRDPAAGRDVPAGAGTPAPAAPRVDKLGYFAEDAIAQLEGATVAGPGRRPVPRCRSSATPACPATSCPGVHGRRAGRRVVRRGRGAGGARAEAWRPTRWPSRPRATRPARPPGRSTCARCAPRSPRHCPRAPFVVDESLTAAAALAPALQTAAPHTQLALTGGAIGQGPPGGAGGGGRGPGPAGVAVAGRRQRALALQALWSQAREQLDVTTVIINNSAYAILRVELARTGAGEAAHSGRAGRMLTLADPTPDFVALATGYGVPARRVETTEDLLRGPAVGPGRAGAAPRRGDRPGRGLSSAQAVAHRDTTASASLSAGVRPRLGRRRADGRLARGPVGAGERVDVVDQRPEVALAVAAAVRGAAQGVAEGLGVRALVVRDPLRVEARDEAVEVGLGHLPVLGQRGHRAEEQGADAAGVVVDHRAPGRGRCRRSARCRGGGRPRATRWPGCRPRGGGRRGRRRTGRGRAGGAGRDRPPPRSRRGSRVRGGCHGGPVPASPSMSLIILAARPADVSATAVLSGVGRTANCVG